MEINKFITKIKKYSLISFILPLITINLCLILFKVLGGIDTYPTLSWNDKEFEYSFNNYIVGAKIAKLSVFPMGELGPSGGNSLKVILSLQLDTADLETFDVEVDIS